LKNASGLTTVNLGNSSSVSVGEAIARHRATPAARAHAQHRHRLGHRPQPVDHRQRRGGQLRAVSVSSRATPTSSPVTPAAPRQQLRSGRRHGHRGRVTNGSAGVATGAAQSYSIPINTALTLAKQIVASDASSTGTSAGPAFLGIEVSATGQSSSGKRRQCRRLRRAWCSSGGSGSGSTSATSGATIVAAVWLPGGCRRARQG